MKKKTIPAKTIVKKKKIQKKKRKRVGTFFFFLIIIAGSGYVFFKGWIQLKIPENNCAVIFSKLQKDGYDNKLYYPGDFVWRWEAIIPGFVTVHNFPLHDNKITINYKASLPSSDIYSEFSEINSDFEYSLSITASYKLEEEEILKNVLEGDLNSEKFIDFSKEIEASVKENASLALWQNITSVEKNPESLFNVEWKEKLKKDIQSNSSKIELKEVSITFRKIPDIELYNQAKNNFLTIMKLKNRIRQEQVTLTVAAEESNQRKLNQLREYGEIITQYPLLIQFLALKSDPEYSHLVDEIFETE